MKTLFHVIQQQNNTTFEISRNSNTSLIPYTGLRLIQTVPKEKPHCQHLYGLLSFKFYTTLYSIHTMYTFCIRPMHFKKLATQVIGSTVAQNVSLAQSLVLLVNRYDLSLMF